MKIRFSQSGRSRGGEYRGSLLKHRWSALLIFCLIAVVLLPLSSTADSIFSGIQEAREYRTAVGLLKQGDYELARTQYRSFIKNHPNSSRLSSAYFGLAETYYLQEKYVQAAETYLESLKSGDLSRNYHAQALKRGLDAVNRSNRLDLADDYLNHIDESMELTTDTVMRRVVQILAKNNQSELALKWSRRNYDQNPDSNYWRYETAVLHADLKNYDRARELIQPLLVNESSYQNDATYLMAEINYETGNYVTSREYYRDLMNDSSYRDDARYGLAWIDIKKRRITEAKDTLKSLTENSESLRVQAAKDLARIYRSEKDDAATRLWYKRAIEWSSEPQQSRLRIEFGDYFVNTDRLQKAVPYYEAARNLGLKAEKRLIRGYLVQNQFRKATEELRTLQENDKLTDPVWDRRLALAYYHLGEFERALETLPSLDKASDRNERRRILSLKGSLFYRLGQWKESQSVYKTMSREYDVVESKYYLALLADKLRDTENALVRLRSLQKNTDDPYWSSKINYQLARLYFETEQYGKFRDNIAEIDPSRLSPILRSELKILSLADEVRIDPDSSRLLGKARKLRESARKYNQVERWYGYLAQLEVAEEWWDELLLPTLQDEPKLIDQWGARTVRILRRRDLLGRSFDLARKLVEKVEDPSLKRDVKAELFNTLIAQKNYQILGQYLTGDSEWDEWKGSNRRSLGLALARYHRSMEEPRAGYESLRKLERTGEDMNEDLKRQLNEWIASFEIELGDYENARQRLRTLGQSRRSPSGTVNLSIAEYHLGDTPSSYRRLKRLHRRGDTQPLALYDYAFRILRDRHKSEVLHDWSRDLIGRLDEQEESVRPLLLDNIRYWINNDYPDRGLEYLAALKKETNESEENIPIRYYRAMAYYNKGDLKKASSILKTLRNSVSLDSVWTKRVLRSEIEINLRKNDWRAAYNRWKELNNRQLGGESGTRLLSSRGLRSSPGDFKDLLETMEKQYPEYLSQGESLFWEARLNEKNKQPERAAEMYRSYLNKDHQNYRQQATLRLARLNDELGRHEKSLQLYRDLFKQTENPLYRLRAGVQLRKLGRLEKSRSLLEEVASNNSDLKSVARYQLGYTHLAQKSETEALNAFRASLDNTSSQESWVNDARQRSVEIALKAGQTQTARSMINGLKDGPRRTLFQAELNRQTDNLDRAVDLLASVKSQVTDDSSLRNRYRSIAAAVHWEAGNYQQLTGLFESLPDSAQQQEWYTKSLIQLGELERVDKLLESLQPVVRSGVRKTLADAYYDNSDWQSALKHYRELPASPRTRFRVGNIHRQLNEPEKAYGVWVENLEQTANRKSKSEWIQSTVDGLIVLTPTVEKWNRTAAVLDQHWSLPFTDKEDVALKALKWSLKSNDDELVQRFLGRTKPPGADTFETLAAKLASSENWTDLRQWVAKYSEGSENEPQSLAYRYYQLVVDLRTKDGSADPERINNFLNEALQEKSRYAMKSQALLGDYYYENGNYKQAAIEYRKVDLLFEDDSPDPKVRLRLARSYLEIGQPDKARPLLESLTSNSVPDTVRREAKKWLNSHSGES